MADLSTQLRPAQGHDDDDKDDDEDGDDDGYQQFVRKERERESKGEKKSERKETRERDARQCQSARVTGLPVTFLLPNCSFPPFL